MRIRVPLALALVVAVPAVALGAAPPPATAQEVSGTLAVPNPTKESGTNVTRTGRTAGLVGPETNGVTSWFFAVEPRSWGGTFALTTTTAGADLDIIFYSDPGSVTGPAVLAGEFVGTAGDGEAGVVPVGATRAQVYAAAAPNAAFSYAATGRQQVRLGRDDLDVTVVRGAVVEWVNQTADYSFVQGPDFTSGTGPGSGIPVGGTYSRTFTKLGSFAYTTSTGSGTVTVTAS